MLPPRYSYLTTVNIADHFEDLARLADLFAFQFLDLPPELRNHVYEYLLAAEHNETLQHRGSQLIQRHIQFTTEWHIHIAFR